MSAATAQRPLRRPTTAYLLCPIGNASASISAVPGFEGHLWITAAQALYRSRDAGASFEPVAGVEESHGIRLGKAAPGSSYPALYLSGKVGRVQGFHRSDDIGQAWVRINDDEHEFGFVNVIEGDPREQARVYLGTSGRGMVYGVPKRAE
jgi:hypothetical protein